MEVESNTARETYEHLTGLPGMRELIGEVKLQDVESAGFTIVNKEWEATVSVKRADIERDRIGIYRPNFAELATMARNHPHVLVASLLNNSFADLDYTGDRKSTRLNSSH